MAETTIHTVDGLLALVGEPKPAAANKARPTLHPLDRQWLAASPFCLVATSGLDGTCDVSPKGDPAGQLTYVLDDTTIASPSARAISGSTATATCWSTRTSG